jgi:glc operon protein GlcG
MPVNLVDAKKIIEAAQAKAQALGVLITVAVVDEGAHVVALERMSGAWPLSVRIAEGKAAGAAMMGRDGGAIAGIAQERPAFFNAIDRMSHRPLVPGIGSLLIKQDGVTVGAIGISGAKPEQDLECAEAGLAAL